MAEEAQNVSSAAAVVSGVSVQIHVPASKGEEAVSFYKVAFGAEEVSRTCCPKRKADQEEPSLLCAMLKIGGASFMICGDIADTAAVNETAISRLVMYVTVENVDAAVEKAKEAGASLGVGSDGEPCCGGKVRLVDPFGVTWDVVSPPETAAAEETEA